MANITVRDSSGSVVYMKSSGAGTDVDPFVPSDEVTLAAGTNLAGKVQSSNGDGTPTEFAGAVIGTHTAGPDISTAQTLTKPEGATGLLAQAITQNVRFTLDGTTPTATVGFQLTTGQLPVTIPCPGASIKVIQEAATASLQYQWIK